MLLFQCRTHRVRFKDGLIFLNFLSSIFDNKTMHFLKFQILTSNRLTKKSIEDILFCFVRVMERVSFEKRSFEKRSSCLFISNVQSPCPNEKCSVFSIYTVSKFASPLFKYFSFVLLQPFQTVAGFLAQHGLFSVLLKRVFCASQNIVLLACLLSKQNNI